MTTPIDEAERNRRELVSAVKRLRVLATSDPAKGEALADALVRLTAARLAALDLTDAASDAPEAVLLAARLLARNGAAGPYTSPADATRFFTASALLAAVQSGLGQAEAAGRTLAGVDGWVQQLGRFPLRDHLEPTAVIWSLVARARSLLATDVPASNACADAAAQRLYAAGLEASGDYLSLAVHLLLADVRWAAGLPRDSLAHHRLALATYRRLFAPDPGRLRPGVAQVALAPVTALHGPYAQRLERLDDTVLAVAIRRAELDRSEELGATAPVLAGARARLARALARDGRAVECATEQDEARALDQAAAAVPEAPMPPAGEPCTWTPSSWTGLGTVPSSGSGGEWGIAAARVAQEVQAAVADGVAARVEAERSEARIRARAEADAAEHAREREQAERAARAESAAAAVAAQERDRLQAEAAAVRRQAEEAAARAAADERRRQLAEEHRRRLAVAPVAANAAAAELEAARGHVRKAGDDLGSQQDAHERLAALLRTLAVVEPEVHREELVTTLEALVGLRWRRGDPDGSREAAREARTLAADAGH